MVDRLNVLYEVADLYKARFPNGNAPFQILSRLLEELGEIAAEVNHLERVGAKVAKRGDPQPTKLAFEMVDLLHNALALARHYQIENTIDQAAEQTRRELQQNASQGLAADGSSSPAARRLS